MRALLSETKTEAVAEEVKTERRPLLPQGAELSGAGVHYRVWAPANQKVEVEIFGDAGQVLRTIPLLAGTSGYFHGLDDQGKAGDLYKFRLNGEQSYPDPASRWQPEGVHGPSMVVDPGTFLWGDVSWEAPRFRDLIIYELHVGTFTAEGTFQAAIEYLSHVRDLGANAIEIMPVGDFAGNRNWGYDGVCLFAPAHTYGTPDDFRALVDAAHGLGLAVLLDVVYNHFGPDGNYLGCYIGDYLDEEAKTPWGGAIRYGHEEYKPLRALVAANPVYWMEEFHIDGFRLDATHAIFDQSPRHLLKEITGLIHERGGFAVAEDPRNDAKLVLPEAEGGYGFDGVWADDFHHINRVANTHENQAYFGDFTGSVSELVETLRSGWFYHGQYSRTRKSNRGTQGRHVPPQRFVHCIANHDQVGNGAFGERLCHRISRDAFKASAALLCLTPYTPMLFMGEEWAATSPFLFFTDHNQELGKLVTEGRREEFKDFEAFKNPATRNRIPDPQSDQTFADSKLRWEELEQADHAQILALHKAFLALRNSEPAFRPKSRDALQIEELAVGAVAIRIKGDTADWLILFDLVGGHEGSIEEEWISKARGDQSGSPWQVVLSTNEERFGGAGKSALDAEGKYLRFEVPELLVLKSTAAS